MRDTGPRFFEFFKIKLKEKSGQIFKPRVIAKIFENTQGQPGLVNALCRELVEKVCTDRAKPVNRAGFLKVLDTFFYERGKKQLAEYLKSEGLQEGYYLVFSGHHDEEDPLYEENELDGVRIFSYVGRTQFEPPSAV